MVHFVALLIACHGTETESKPDDDTTVDTGERDTGEEDLIDEEDSGSPDTGVAPDPPDDDVVVESSCGPQPNDQRPQLADGLFEKAMAVEESGCFLEQISYDSNNDGEVDEVETFPLPTALSCDDSNYCEQTLPSFAWAWSQFSEYDYGNLQDHEDMYEGRVEGLRMIDNGVETIRLELTATTSGSSAERRSERIYNSSGNILQETYYFDNSRWFEITNSWENGHLVEQIFGLFGLARRARSAGQCTFPSPRCSLFCSEHGEACPLLRCPLKQRICRCPR